jgi:hypothetical protein
MPSVSLRRVAPADIETIMEIERQPGFEHLVGRSARSIHEELVGDPGHPISSDSERVEPFAALPFCVALASQTAASTSNGSPPATRGKDLVRQCWRW